MTNWIEDLSWPELEQRMRQNALAILPVGAAAKEHGPHLPLATDYIQAHYFADALADKFDALVWPVVNYGYYPVFTDYPGSISVGELSFASTVRNIIDGITNAGTARLVIVNTGISTIAPLNKAMAGDLFQSRISLANCYAGAHFKAVCDELEEQTFGGHADEIETSIMLAIAPEQVDMRAARASEQPILRGRFNRHDASDPNYSPLGVNGDPTRATQAKGQRLVQAILADLSQQIEASQGRQ